MPRRKMVRQEPQYQVSEGGIYPRKDGRYMAQIYIDNERLTYTSTEEKARQWLNKIKAEIALGTYVKPEKPQKQKVPEPAKPSETTTLGEWMDRWLELYARPSVKLATYVSYETYIRRHVKPALGKVLMKDLTVGMLQEFLTKKLTEGRADRQSGGLSSKTVSNIHKMLLPALEQAKLEKLLQENLAKGVKPPKVEKNEMRVLSVEEQKNFAAAVFRFQKEYPQALACAVALFFGTRLGEVLALQWKNVSFEKRQFKIVNTISRLKNLNPNIPSKTTLELRTVKSSHSGRTLDLFDGMYEKLLEHKKAQDELCRKFPGYNPNGFVFVSPDGRPIEPRTYEDFFNKVADAAGIKGATFHTLRHTFATRCIESGMDVLVLSKLLGHASPETTLKLYGHVLSEHKKTSMERIGSMFSSCLEQPENGPSEENADGDVISLAMNL